MFGKTPSWLARDAMLCILPNRRGGSCARPLLEVPTSQTVGAGLVPAPCSKSRRLGVRKSAHKRRPYGRGGFGHFFTRVRRGGAVARPERRPNNVSTPTRSTD